jgi:hypothetical protein
LSKLSRKVFDPGRVPSSRKCIPTRSRTSWRTTKKYSRSSESASCRGPRVSGPGVTRNTPQHPR